MSRRNFIFQFHRLERIEYHKLGISTALTARGLQDCYILNIYHSDESGNRYGDAIPVDERVINHSDGNSVFLPLLLNLPTRTPKAIFSRGNNNRHGNGGSRMIP